MKSFALVLLLAFLWGSSYPLLKVSVETIPPLTVVAVRSLLGGLILLALLGARAKLLWEMRSGSALRALAIQSTFNCIIPWILVSWAVTKIDAGLATILNSLSPIFIFLLTALVTRHEPATGRKFIGVVLGIAGVLTIVGVDALSGVGTRTLAELACVAGAFCYAIAGVIGVRFAKVTPLVPAAGTTLIAAAVLIPLALVVEHPWTIQPSLPSLLALAASAVFSTGLAMVIYFRLLATVGSIAMSSQAYLRIFVGVGLGIVFLGERPSANALIGLLPRGAGRGRDDDAFASSRMKPRMRALLRLALLLPAIALAQAGGLDLPQAEERIVDGTNAFRRAQGLPRVRIDPKLARTAQSFADYMARTDQLAHAADGKQPWERASLEGYDHCFISENIGYQFRSVGFDTAGLAAALVQGWKDSPGHRRNMVQRDVTDTGVGLARSARTGRYYAVQMFGRPRMQGRC